VTALVLASSYGAIGVACAGWLLLRGERTPAAWVGALAVTLVWPLWMPFALSAGPLPSSSPRAAERRVARALARAREAARGTPREALLSEKDSERIVSEVARIARRLDLVESELAALNGAVAEPSAVRDRQLARLRGLALADGRALEELAERSELLATELALARFGEGDEVVRLVAELGARVEALATS